TIVPARPLSAGSASAPESRQDLPACRQVAAPPAPDHFGCGYAALRGRRFRLPSSAEPYCCWAIPEPMTPVSVKATIRPETALCPEPEVTTTKLIFRVLLALSISVPVPVQSALMVYVPVTRR